jgi:endonuclease III
MPHPTTKLACILNRSEKFYGKPKPPQAILRSLTAKADPYEMILYANCGYPATDEACTRGFEALKKAVGLRPQQILAAPESELLEVARGCGMLPEVRVQRWREIAARVMYEFGDDLRAVLKRSLKEARKALRLFPTIGDPGADKILLFTKTAPVPAVPSNCVEVPVRLMLGEPKNNYTQNYRAAQEALRSEIPEDCNALLRAHLLLKHHGREICKRTRPLCKQCSVSEECAYLRGLSGR